MFGLIETLRSWLRPCPLLLPADFTVVTVATLGYGEKAGVTAPFQLACACFNGSMAALRAATSPISALHCDAGDVVPQTTLEMLVDCGVIAIGVLM